MTLGLPGEARQAIEALDPELLAAAQALGLGVLPALTKLTPGLTSLDPPAADVTLERIELEGEGDPDPVSLAAILSAHTAYVRHRGRAEGISTGALSLARLIVWAQRAAMIGGAAPDVRWMGPPARAPESVEGVRLTATAVVTAGGRRHTAKAIAIVAPPESAGP